MFDNIKNFAAIMKNLPELKARAEQMQAELERKTVEADAGGGAVRVTMNGKGRLLRLDIDQPLMIGLAGDDKTMVEELITAAVNNGIEKVQNLLADEMKNATGGMDIPGLDGLDGLLR